MGNRRNRTLTSPIRSLENDKVEKPDTDDASPQAAMIGS